MKKVFNDRIEWRNNKGEVHKEKGPAIEYNNGTKCWYKNGEHHRLDGPAIEHSDGTKYWWLDGRLYSEEKWFEALTFEKQIAYLFKLGEK